MKIIQKFKQAYTTTVSEDGNLIAITGGSTFVYNKKYEIIFRCKPFSNTNSVIISKNNSMIAFKNTSGEISIWSLHSKEKIKNIAMEKNEGENILFSPDNKYIIDADWSGNIMLIDINTLTYSIIEKFEDSMINYIDFNKETCEFIFCFSNIENDNFYFIIWKYPFENNDYERINIPYISNTFEKKIRYIYKIKMYYYLSKNNISLMDKEFKLISSNNIISDHLSKPVKISNDLNSFVTIKHGINIYSFPQCKLLDKIFIKGAKDAIYIENDKKLVVAGSPSSYIIEL